MPSPSPARRIRSFRHAARVAGACAALPAVAGLLGAQQISTLGAAGALHYTTEFGEYSVPNQAERRAVRSVGQTFVAPTGLTRLDSFTFQTSAMPWWAGATNPTQVRYHAFVMAFDEARNRPVGAVLWTSPMVAGTTDATGYGNVESNRLRSDGFVARTFTTGGLTLAAGTSYVALLSQIYEPADIRDRWNTPYPGYAWNTILTTVATGGYAGGHLYRTTGHTFGVNSPDLFTDFLGNGPGGDGTPQMSYNFDDRTGGWDAAFEASFGPAAVPVSATPEPASVLLVGAGALGLAAAARRRPAA